MNWKFRIPFILLNLLSIYMLTGAGTYVAQMECGKVLSIAVQNDVDRVHAIFRDCGPTFHRVAVMVAIPHVAFSIFLYLYIREYNARKSLERQVSA